ncbi:proteophosphoglycan 5 [Ceratobasidium sp. AG-Ba]|nr:proteophosphoglycan 5 [Ceratobasidium sp. AG-Ba]
MGIEELRSLLKDLLKQQDVVAGRQDDHSAILQELRNRPPPTVVYQAPEVSELSEHRVALTKIENILDDLFDHDHKLRNNFVVDCLADFIQDSEDDERRLQRRWDEMTKRPSASIPPGRTSPLPSIDGGIPPSQASESQVEVPPPTATTALPLIPTLRPRPRRRRARSASPTLTFERLIGSVASSVTSSEEAEEMFEIPPFKGGKTAPTPAAPTAPARPVFEEPRAPSVAEQVEDIDIDFERKLREIRKQRGQGDGTYIPSMPQPPAEPVLPPTLYPEREEDDTTPRPPSPPSDLGQSAHRALPYLNPGIVPALLQLPTRWDGGQSQAQRLFPLRTSSAPSLRFAPWRSDRPHRASTGSTGASGLPDYGELLDLVRGGAGSQEVVAEQQREIIRYLGGLNTWLERDVIDRQFELRQLSERMDHCEMSC